MAWVFLILGLLVVLVAVVRIAQPDENMTRKQAFATLGVGSLICLFSYAHLVHDPDAPVTLASPNTDPACRADIRCWGEHHRLAAEIQCRIPLEQRARYGFEWTDGWTESKFERSTIKWKNQEKGQVTYFGDKLRFQNVFGTFQRVRYRCDYDTENETVLHTRIVIPDEKNAIPKLYADK